MTQVTAWRKEFPDIGGMRIVKKLNWQRKFLVFLGVLFACAFDLLVNFRFRQVVLDFYKPVWIAWMLLALLALFLGASFLERYVRPLSTAGAISTGFCGYALISFLIPLTGA